MKIEFFTEKMNLLIGYYDNLLACYKFEDRKTLGVLLKKLITNLDSANILISKGYITESKIILRSAIETVVLFVYLAEFPKKTDEYIKDSQLLGFKNNFMVYKEFKNIQNNLNFKDVVAEYSLKKLNEETEQCFSMLNKENQNKILQMLNITEYELNEETFNKLDKYFKKFRPFFMDFKTMFDELKHRKIAEALTLREAVYSFYNEGSQVAHGRFQDWAFPKDTKNEIKHLFGFMQKSINVPLLTLKEVIKINPKREANELTKLLWEEFNNLSKWVYEDVE